MPGSVFSALNLQSNAGEVVGPATPSRRGGRWTACIIEELRNGRDKLRWRERLDQEHAIGDALYSPLVGIPTGYVDYGKSGIELSRMFRDLPAVDCAAQSDIGDESPVAAIAPG